MNQHLDQGRHSDACRAVSRRLLWTRRGKPSSWLLLLTGVCAFVCIKSAEMRPKFSCVAGRKGSSTAVPRAQGYAGVALANGRSGSHVQGDPCGQ
jgi:hypothetical protein